MQTTPKIYQRSTISEFLSCTLVVKILKRYIKFMIGAKALDGERYPLPLCEYMWMCDGERGSGPEGADDLCLVSFER